MFHNIEHDPHNIRIRFRNYIIAKDRVNIDSLIARYPIIFEKKLHFDIDYVFRTYDRDFINWYVEKVKSSPDSRKLSGYYLRGFIDHVELCSVEMSDYILSLDIWTIDEKICSACGCEIIRYNRLDILEYFYTDEKFSDFKKFLPNIMNEIYDSSSIEIIQWIKSNYETQYYKHLPSLVERIIHHTNENEDSQIDFLKILLECPKSIKNNINKNMGNHIVNCFKNKKFKMADYLKKFIDDNGLKSEYIKHEPKNKKTKSGSIQPYFSYIGYDKDYHGISCLQEVIRQGNWKLFKTMIKDIKICDSYNDLFSNAVYNSQFHIARHIEQIVYKIEKQIVNGKTVKSEKFTSFIESYNHVFKECIRSCHMKGLKFVNQSHHIKKSVDKDEMFGIVWDFLRYNSVSYESISEMIDWLITEKLVDIHYKDDAFLKKLLEYITMNTLKTLIQRFPEYCRENILTIVDNSYQLFNDELLQLLYDFQPFDVRYDNDKWFKYACKREHLDDIYWFCMICPLYSCLYHESGSGVIIPIIDGASGLRKVLLDLNNHIEPIDMINGIPEGLTCRICWNDEVDYMIKLTCRHEYCSCCLEMHTRRYTRCPTCRQNIMDDGHIVHKRVIL